MKIPPLTLDERQVFSAIVAAPRCSMVQIAARLGITACRTGKMVMHLERLRLIETVLWSAPSPRWGGKMRRQRLCSPAPWVLL